MPSESGDRTTTFDASAVRALRDRARSEAHSDVDPPAGWSESTVDPNAVLAAFSPPLHLKAGFELRAYQLVYGPGAHRGAGNGVGVVWAVPANSPRLEPDHCLELTAGRGARPRPLRAQDPMAAVGADGSPWSFLCASLAKRELDEIGAMWHGEDWATHVVIDRPPNDDPLAVRECRELMSEVANDWTWTEDPPLDWRPRVEMTEGRTRVFLHTFSLRDRQTITRHVDDYALGDVNPRTSRVVIALGGHGLRY